MKRPLYAALDLHSAYSVLGSMDHGGKTQPRMRFATEAERLRAQVSALKQKRRPVHLTMEAGALTRWASGIVRPLVERLLICEPRHNRLINSNPTKRDEADVEGMCLLLRLGKLKEVWMGTERTREIYRALVYELLNWRDAQRFMPYPSGEYAVVYASKRPFVKRSAGNRLRRPKISSRSSRTLVRA